MTALHDAPSITPVDADLRTPAQGQAAPRDQAKSVFKHVGLIILSIVMIYPLIWLVVSSLKPNDKIFTDIGLFGNDFTLRQLRLRLDVAAAAVRRVPRRTRRSS